MRKTALLILSVSLLTAGLLAQNPNLPVFPNSIAQDKHLLVAVDSSMSVLAANINQTTLSIPVADGTKFRAHQVVRIDNESILICSVNGNILNVCNDGRGFGGSTPAIHGAGAEVKGLIYAWHHNQLAAEIKAIQQALGVNLSSVAPAQHNHDAQNITSGTLPVSRGGTGASTPEGARQALSTGYVRVQANPPSSCSVGDLWFDSDATPGKNWFGCTAANTWTLLRPDTIEWGSITGTLSNQTDLQTALDGKANATHNHDSTYQALNQKNQPNGYAGLDGSGKLSASQVPDLSSVYQPLDSDLTTIAGLSCSPGQIIKRNASGLWECSNDATGTSPTWGSITGTLSNQTDLQAALDGKANATHNHDSTYQALNQKNQPNGYAGLDGSGKLSPSQIPDLSSIYQPTDADLTAIAGLSCPNGQIIKRLAGQWACAPDDTGGSPSWGSITGTISNQTDLQAALDAKASTTHQHSAGDITSGALPTSRGGLGSTSWTAGSLPYFNGTSFVEENTRLFWESVSKQLRIDGDIKVGGANANTMDGRIAAYRDHSNTSGEHHGIYSILRYSPASYSTAYNYAVRAHLNMFPSSGVFVDAADYNHAAVHGQLNIGGAGSVVGVEALHSNAWFQDTVSVGTYRAFSAHTPIRTGGTPTVTKAVGLHIQGMKTSFITSAYGIEQRGADDINYFEGNTGIGVDPPTTKLDVNGIVRARNGFRISASPAAGTYLRSNGSEFVESSIQASDLPDLSGTYQPKDSDLTAIAGLSCSAGQIIKRDSGGNWVCGEDVSGGTPSWGSITGTLSNQTDLQAALDGKANATHNHDSTYQALSQKNQANGYAGLDASGLLAVSQIPGLPAAKITSGQLSTAYGGTGRGVTWQPGSVTFINSSNLFEQDNANLFWDNTNKRLGIGNNAPTEKLEVTGNVKATSFIGTLNGAAPWSQLSGKPSLSGTGSCTNQFVRGLNAEAAPTCATVGTADVAAALKTGVINYTFFDVNNDLPDTLDIPSIFVNRGPDITITEVYCEINSGSASINLQRNDGSPANILSSNLNCSTAGATTTSFVSGENSILSGHKINHVTVSVGSGLRRMNIAIKYTVN